MTKKVIGKKLKHMLKKRYYYVSFIVMAMFLWNCNSTLHNKVYFIPSLHGLHKINENYSYDSLKQIISRLKPDIIAVEIRPEDINQDSTYLKENYPYEMRMMKYWFPNSNIVGFDWLGHDIEGKSIPDNYWEEISLIKKYERELNSDSLFSKKCATCNTFTKQRLEILKSLSLKDIYESNDSLLTKQYYECLEKQLNGSKHERILTFYNERNEKILANIKTIIKNNKNKTIAIITGDDHYVYLKDAFLHNKLYK